MRSGVVSGFVYIKIPKRDNKLQKIEPERDSKYIDSRVEK